ncbi:MAG: protein kinase, partial [Planctomycetota bacterium]
DALVRTGRISMYQLGVAVMGRSDRLILGEYTVVEPIGAGGMGEVLLAIHRRMKRKVAIKFLPERFAGDDSMVKRFEREVEVAAQLSHANIVTAFDAGKSDDTHYLVMEYVDGCDLRSLIRSRGPLKIDDAVKCVLQAGSGIEHAHQKEVIHRDIKPANLLLDRKGNVKVLDMGLARWSSAAAEAAASDLSLTGAAMGTVDFMPPEQAISAKRVDHRADIYSLGCTLFTLANGRALFAGDTVLEKVMAHQTADIPDLVVEKGDRHRHLNEVFKRMVAKEPDDRFDSMREACGALATCLTDESKDVQVELPIPERDSVLDEFQYDTKDRRPEASFASTLDVRDDSEPSAVPAARVDGGSKRIGMILMVGLLLFGGGWFGIPTIIRLVTPEGTLVIKCKIEGAIVEIDGQQVVEVTDPNTEDTYRFDLPKGEHKVRATLPSGVVIRSAVVEIDSREEELFEAQFEWRDEVEEDPVNVFDGPDVLTVAKREGAAEYQSITEASADVKPGQTIRIIDDSDYEESLRLLTPSRFTNVTIEATGQSRWLGSVSAPGCLVVEDIDGIKLRGLTFALRPGALFGVLMGKQCNGGGFEDCTFTVSDPNLGVAGSLLSLEAVENDPKASPLVVSNCNFSMGNHAIQVMGMVMATKKPLKTSGILIHDCRFESCGYGIGCLGHFENVWIVQNIFDGCPAAAIQFQHMLNEPKNVVFANNTMFSSSRGISIWENGNQPSNVKVLANLSLGGSGDEWFVWDSGGNDKMARGPGDGAAYRDAWTFANNFREGTPPPDDWPLKRGWIPPAESSDLLARIEVQSRDSSEANFTRPKVDSKVAKGGLGGDFPDYAGALPPESKSTFDWKNAFKNSL